MHSIDEIALRLQPSYTHFDVKNRLLFSGHSHQAWPDVALEGLNASFQTAAKLVDEKWSKSFEQIEVLRNYLRNFYSDPKGEYSYAHNTHELLIKWLSALNLPQKPHLLTTSSEFHSVFRQLKSLEHAGIDVDWIQAYPIADLAEKIQASLKEETAGVIVSRVFYDSGIINSQLEMIAEICRKNGVPLLIDDYHGTNVVPLNLGGESLSDAYLLVGGYKYLQWGEGNCFLRYPRDTNLKPIITGWFASFSSLSKPRSDEILFDENGNLFMGATIEPASSFRAARVVRFFEENGLDGQVLRNQYLEQLRYLERLIAPILKDSSFSIDHPEYDLASKGGFLSIKSEHALQMRSKLLEHGVFTDARDNILRIGMAPYISSAQIEAFAEHFGSLLKFFQRS